MDTLNIGFLQPFMPPTQTLFPFHYLPRTINFFFLQGATWATVLFSAYIQHAIAHLYTNNTEGAATEHRPRVSVLSNAFTPQRAELKRNASFTVHHMDGKISRGQACGQPLQTPHCARRVGEGLWASPAPLRPAPSPRCAPVSTTQAYPFVLHAHV